MSGLLAPSFFAVAMILSRSLCGYLVTPITLFSGVWLMTISLYQLDPILVGTFSFPVNPNTYRLYLVSFLGFLAGSVPHMVIWANARHSRASPADAAPEADYEKESRALRPWTLWLLLVLAAGVGFKLVLVIHRYGNLLGSLPQIRNDFVAGYLTFPMFASITTVLTNLAILNLGVLLAYRTRSTNILLTSLTLMLVFVNDITIADKEGLRQSVLLLLAIYYATTVIRRTRPRALSYAIGGGVVVAFASLFTLITDLRGNGPTSLMDLTLRHFYLNIAGNFVSSSWFTAHPLPSFLPGGNTFHGLYAFMNAVAKAVTGHGFLSDLRFGADPNVPYHAFLEGGGTGSAAAYYAQVGRGPFNTTSYLGYIYSDFGPGGVAVLSYLWGMALTLLFLRALKFRRVPDIQALALASIGLLMSVRGFYYGGAGFWISLVCVFVQGRLLETVGRKREEA